MPGCTAMGATIEAAIANAAEAVRDWAAEMEALGEMLPAPRPLEALRRDKEVMMALAEGATLASSSPGA
jgi:predicted RNase H-like HicB family nuclease